MPGFGDFLGGFATAYTDDLEKQREETRKAEDAELENRGKMLQTMISTMNDNPANAPLVQQAWKDYMTTMGAVGKRRANAGGLKGFRGETELPSSVFLDMLNKGEIPAFGQVGLNMPPMGLRDQPQTQGATGPEHVTGDGLEGQPQSDTGAFSAQGGNIPSRRVGSQPVNPGSRQPITVGPLGPPPQPQPMVPYQPGTNRMNQAVNQTAEMAQTDPRLAFPTATYSPGMMLGPEDKAKVAGIADYTKKRLDQRALVANLQEAGASRDEIVDALIPGSSTAHSPFGPARLFIDPNTGHQFYGMTNRFTGEVHMAGNPNTTVPGALPFGYQSTTTQDANGNLINVYRPTLPATSTGQPGSVVENTGVQGKPTNPSLKQVVGADGKTYWALPQEAIGQQSPQAASSNPDLIKDTAEANYQAKLATIESRLRQAPGTPGYIDPAAAEILKAQAQKEYDAKIGYNREQGGGTLPSAPTVKGPAGDVSYVTPSLTTGSPWYVQQKLPALNPGKGPTWNPVALARMRQYLEEKGKARGVTMVTDDQVRTAMKNERLRTDAGLIGK